MLLAAAGLALRGAKARTQIFPRSRSLNSALARCRVVPFSYQSYHSPRKPATKPERRSRGAGEPEHWGAPTPRPLPVHVLRPECGRAIGVSKCCGWCQRAPTSMGRPPKDRHTQWGNQWRCVPPEKAAGRRPTPSPFMPVHALRPEARLCDSVYPNVVVGVCRRAPTWQGQAPGGPQEPVRPLCRCATTTTDRPSRTTYVKQRSGLSASCLTFMHCALHGTFLGITPRCTLPPPTSRVRRAAGAAKGLLARHGAAHLCPIPPLPYRCPGRHGGAHCLPTSCELALAPLAPPHTRRFLGDSFN